MHVCFVLAYSVLPTNIMFWFLVTWWEFSFATLNPAFCLSSLGLKPLPNGNGYGNDREGKGDEWALTKPELVHSASVFTNHQREGDQTLALTTESTCLCVALVKV